jgi:hypothetical protein
METLTKPFNYAAFIEELRILRDSFAEPPENHQTNESIVFKQWRHQVIDLIQRIRSQGYSINCSIELRRFRITYGYGQPSIHQHKEFFNKAHSETMIEINTIIDNYEKYGAPRNPLLASALSQTALNSSGSDQQRRKEKWDADSPLSWYWQNIPARIMVRVGIFFCTVIGTAFCAGVIFNVLWPNSLLSAAIKQSSMLLPPSKDATTQSDFSTSVIESPSQKTNEPQKTELPLSDK